MKDFEFYVTNKLIRKQLSDINLAKATAKDSVERLKLSKDIKDTQKPKYALENAYESIRELIDAILYLDGYKSYTHEGSIAYLKIIGFSEKEIMDIDRLRVLRNKIKYYGENVSKEDAEKAIKTAEDINKNLIKIKPILKDKEDKIQKIKIGLNKNEDTSKDKNTIKKDNA